MIVSHMSSYGCRCSNSENTIQIYRFSLATASLDGRNRLLLYLWMQEARYGDKFRARIREYGRTERAANMNRSKTLDCALHTNTPIDIVNSPNCG